MKKRFFVCILCTIFLFGMAKPKMVTPFLKPLIEELKTKTNVPVLLPAYFPSFQHEYHKYPTAQSEATKNEYNVYLYAFRKHLPINDPKIVYHSQSNVVGSLSGEKTQFKPFTRPQDYIKGTKIKNIQFYKDPRFDVEMSIYGAKDNWEFLIDGVGSKTGGIEIASSFIESLNKVNWLKKQDIKRAKVFIVGDPSSPRVMMSWESKKGYVYSFDSQFGIDETIKIVNNMVYTK